MRADMGDRLLGLLGYAVQAVVYAMLVLPAVIVAGASFTSGMTLSFPPSGFSFRWYVEAAANPALMNSLWISTKLALIATACSLVLGISAAFGIDRYEFRGRGAFQALALSPLIVPATVLGLAILMFVSFLGVGRSFTSLLIGHVLVTLPYVLRTVLSNLQLFDRNLEQAAMNLRASPFRILRSITIPVLFPGIMAAAVFALVTSFGNITLSIFLGSGADVPLPVQMFTYVEQSSTPVIAAVSTMVIVITMVIIGIVERLVGIDRIA